MAVVNLAATYMGYDGSRSIYRIDLSQAGLSSIQAITIVDDGVRSGGIGGASGTDIDFLKVGPEVAAESVKNLANEGFFNFESGVVYRPGYMTPWTPGKSALWNSSSLFGTTSGNIYNNSQSDDAAPKLGEANGDLDASVGSLSLGEGGRVTFLLDQAITQGADGQTRYLYIAEYGDPREGFDQFTVLLSDQRAELSSAPNLSLVGSWADDAFVFGRGVNANVGSGDDYIASFGGNDVVYAWSGNDVVYGGSGADWLEGEDGNDRLYGEAGKDWLSGGAGNDKLSGGLGKDQIYSGSGRDVFLFDTKAKKSNVDRIHDFSTKYDKIYLDNKYFKKLGKKGTEDAPKKLKKAYFEIGKKADDKNDYLVYNKKNGYLYYDYDGSGKGKASPIAKLDKNLKLKHDDFWVI